MKRIYLPALLLLPLCAAACAPAPTNSTNTNANSNAANSNAANANSAAAATWTDADVIADERAAWDAIRSKNHAAFSDMLAAEFVDVTPQAVLDKNGTVEYVRGAELTEVSLSDFRVVKIDADAAIVVYKESSKGTVGGKPIPAGSAFHSTVKVWRGGKWLAVFHQSSPEVTQPPAPSPTVSASASPAASASASPAAAAAATTADVEANEKLVWDALRRKDWDAFAGYLAEDQLEVWGTGVNTKAQSVKGVQSVDFSGFQMSDFKTVTIDGDAKIATYTVKGNDRGKPFTERSATVWANRGGKWLVVFHQGTLVEQPGA